MNHSGPGSGRSGPPAAHIHWSRGRSVAACDLRRHTPDAVSLRGAHQRRGCGDAPRKQATNGFVAGGAVDGAGGRARAAGHGQGTLIGGSEGGDEGERHSAPQRGHHPQQPAGAWAATARVREAQATESGNKRAGVVGCAHLSTAAQGQRRGKELSHEGVNAAGCAGDTCGGHKRRCSATTNKFVKNLVFPLFPTLLDAWCWPDK